MIESVRSGRIRPGVVLALGGTAAGFMVVVFGAGAWAGTYYSNVRIIAIVAALIGILGWLMLALVRPQLRPASQLTGAFAAALAAFGISEVFAWNVRLGFDYLGYAVLLTVLYLLLVRLWATPGVGDRLVVLSAILCAFVGVLFIAITVVEWIGFWSQLERFVVPPLRLGYEGLWLGSPNAVAAFQVLLYATVAGGFWDQGRGARLVTVALGIVVLADVVLSASRGSWLGIGLATVVSGGAVLATSAGRAAVRAVLAHFHGWYRAGAAAVAIAAAIAGLAVGPSFAARLSDFAGADLRTSFLAASWRMFLASPLTGLGPGSWVPARLSFTDASEVDYYIPHAHNVPAQMLSEFGLLGVIAAVVATWLLLRLITRGMRHPTPAVHSAGLAMLFACVYLSGQQMVDAFVHQPAILAVLALPIARLDAMLTPGEAKSARWLPAWAGKRLLTGMMIVAVFVATGAAMWPEPAAQAEERAVAASDLGEWSAAYSLSSQAASEDPRLAPYQFLRGLSAAELGDLGVARDALSTAATLDDYPAAWLDLAAVQLRLDDSAARTSLDRAVRLGAQQPMIAVPAAQLYLELGDAKAASAQLAAAFKVLPSLAGDPLWSTAEWSAVANAAISEDLAKLDRWSALLLALEAGRFAAASSLAGKLDAGAGGIGRLTFEAWTGNQAAFARLHALAQANPLDATTVGLCLRIARLHDGAGSAPEWTCDGHWWFGIYIIARIGTGIDEAQIPGPEPYPHALFAYRRPGPHELLVPWVFHLDTTIA